MQKALILTAGIAGGCLATLALHIPLLKPLADNTTNVAAAVCSSVLAVAGAYALWRHQVQKRQRDLVSVAVEIFAPVYEALLLVEKLVDRESAEQLLDAREGRSVSRENPVAHIVYQLEVLPDAIDAAKVAAELSVQHWECLDDVLGGFDLRLLPRLIHLHQVANAAIDRLPALKADVPVKPSFLKPIPFDERKVALLRWGVGRMAGALNALDGGKRDTSGFDALEANRAEVLRVIHSAPAT